ncbi:MAG: alanine racemase [Eubacterium sp.]|nr:alanine racemase [Eubacterium sp.]
MSTYLRSYAEVSLDAICHNLDEVKKLLTPDVKIMAVVKANAYGHGAVPVAKALESRADFFAVAMLEEAVELREAGITHPILILGYTSPSQYREMLAYDVRPCIYDYKTAEALGKTALEAGCTARPHIAVDTGMNRIGFQVTEEDADQIAAINALPGIEIEGLFTHLSCADMTEKTHACGQFHKYAEMVSMLEKRGVQIPVRHICNSAGTMEFDGNRYEMVRAGIVMYGLYPSEEVDKSRLDLIPALSWKTHVIHVKEIGPGEGVSYGATYVTEKEKTRVATISIGYADGYPRALSNKGRVLIRGKSAPIIGRVCMDQIMVDASGIPDVRVEDTVTLIGHDGSEHISIEEVADPAGRFNYEMACTITSRVPRVYV